MNKEKITRNILIAFCVIMIIVLLTLVVLVLSGSVDGAVLKYVNMFAGITSTAVVCYRMWHNVKKRKEEGPELKVIGTVVSKRNATDPKRNPLMLPEDWFCYITFKFTDNTIHELCTSAHFYMFLKEGQNGVLTYKNVNGQLKLMNFEKMV